MKTLWFRIGEHVGIVSGKNIEDSYEGWDILPLALKCDNKTFIDIVETYGLQQDDYRFIAVKTNISEMLEPFEWSIITIDDKYIIEVTGSVDDLLLLKLSSPLESYNRNTV